MLAFGHNHGYIFKCSIFIAKFLEMWDDTNGVAKDILLG